MLGFLIEFIEVAAVARASNLGDRFGVAVPQAGIVADTALLAGGGQPHHRSLPDQRALEFGRRAEDLQSEFALRRSRVDRTSEQPKMRALLSSLSMTLEQVRQRARQAVDPHGDHHVAAPEARYQLREHWSRAGGARSKLLVDLGAASGFQLAALPSCVLAIGRDPRVAYQRHGSPYYKSIRLQNTVV